MRNWWAAVLLLAVLLLMVVPGLSLAADEGEGNPITDPRFDLGIWSIIVFVVLLLVLRAFAWGPMLQGLQTREQNIRNALKEAEDARASAQALRAELKKQLDQANDQVRGLLDEARRDAQTAKDQMLAEARKEIQAEWDRKHREIEMVTSQALQEIMRQTAQVATLVSSKVLRRQMSAEDHSRLVDEALVELRSAGAQRQQMLAGMQA